MCFVVILAEVGLVAMLLSLRVYQGGINTHDVTGAVSRATLLGTTVFGTIVPGGLWLGCVVVLVLWRNSVGRYNNCMCDSGLWN